MSPPKISIVLPTYNGERYLRESIQSCLDQTFADWELIVVDDHSSDSTPAIVQEFSARDPRVLSIRHEINKKLPAALNTGFREACGEFFTWTSDDNRYRPAALQTMLDALERSPGTDIVYCDYTNIDDEGRELDRCLSHPPEFLVKTNCIGACFLYRREVDARNGGYDESKFMIEDYDFWLRASLHSSFLCLHEDLYLYRKHAQSLTSKFRQIQEMSDERFERIFPRMTWLNAAGKFRGRARMIKIRYERLGAWTLRKELLFAALRHPIYTLKLVPRELLFIALAGGPGKKLYDMLVPLYDGQAAAEKKP